MPFVDATCAGRYAINLFAALSNSRCRGAAADMRPVILGFGQKGNNAVRACVDRALPLKCPGAAFASRKMQHSIVMIDKTTGRASVLSRVDTPAACPHWGW